MVSWGDEVIRGRGYFCLIEGEGVEWRYLVRQYRLLCDFTGVTLLVRWCLFPTPFRAFHSF